MIMKPDWSRVALETVCDRVTVGHVGAMRDQYRRVGIPFLRSQNVQPFRLDLTDVKHVDQSFHQKLKKSALRPGDVVVVRTGYPGTACMIPTHVSLANCADLVVITPGPDLAGGYLVALLNSAWGKGQVRSSLVGVAQQHFNVTVAKQLQIPLPPLVVQQRISSLLAAYQELIENNLRRIEILEQMAQAMYREWFVNFRFPGHLREQLPPESDWKGLNLFDVSEVRYGYGFKSKRFRAGPPGNRVVRIRDVPKNTTSTYTDENPGESYNVLDGDVLVGMDGDFHMCVWHDGKAMLNQRVARLRPKIDAPVLWLFHALKGPIGHFNSTITGTTVAHLGDRHLRTIELLVPPESLMALAHEHFNPIEKTIRNLLRQNRLLRRTRDLLLPKLISGEIDVSELDIDTSWLAA